MRNDLVFVFGWQSSFCTCIHVEDLRSVSYHQPVVSFQYEPVYRVTCTWLQIPCLTMLFLQLVTLVLTISVHHMDTRATHFSPDGYTCYSLVCCRSHGRFYPTGTFVLVIHRIFPVRNYSSYVYSFSDAFA